MFPWGETHNQYKNISLITTLLLLCVTSHSPSLVYRMKYIVGAAALIRGGAVKRQLVMIVDSQRLLTAPSKIILCLEY